MIRGLLARFGFQLRCRTRHEVYRRAQCWKELGHDGDCRFGWHEHGGIVSNLDVPPPVCGTIDVPRGARSVEGELFRSLAADVEAGRVDGVEVRVDQESDGWVREQGSDLRKVPGRTVQRITVYRSGGALSDFDG